MIYPNFLLRLYFKAKKRYTYLEFEEIVKNIMENTIKLSVPLEVDINTGSNWYLAK